MSRVHLGAGCLTKKIEGERLMIFAIVRLKWEIVLESGEKEK